MAQAPTVSPPAEPSRTRRSHLPLLARATAAIAGGVLVYLAVPPRTSWWLAPLGFAVLALVLHGRHARAGLGNGFLFGLGFTVPLLAWTGEYVGVIAWLPLAASQGLFIGVTCAAITQVTPMRGGPLWAALLWTAGETLRAVFPFGGFPWAKVAFTQPEGWYLPLAAVGGTALLGFAVVLTGFGLGVLARGLRAGHRRGLVVPALTALLPLAAGFAALPLVSTAADSGTATVAAIQGNVPRAGLDFNAQRRAVLDNHVDQTLRLADDIDRGRADQPDLVIWPENASDIDPLRNADAYQRISQAARAVGAPIAVGTLLIGDDGRPRNTVLLWDPDRGPVDSYTKRQLQPFGETMPWRGFFRLFTSYVDRANNFVPGSEPTVFAVGGVRLAVATCYEVAFDEVVRENVRNGATLLAVPTNNATFGDTEMTYQQLAMDRVRAVEHGRAVVVAATSGVSAIVLPDGSVTQSTDLFTPATLVETVPLRAAATMADRLGAWPERTMVAVGLVVLAAAITAGVRRRRAAATDPGDPH